MTRDCTIVLPCYNEEGRVAKSLATLDDWFGSSVDVLVIDDGSSDRTFERASAFARTHSNVRVHRLARNRGKGIVVRAAVPLLRTDRTVIIDADLSFDQDSLVRALEALDRADMSVGNRRHHASEYAVPVRLFGFLYRRHVVGLVFNRFVRLLVPVGLPDTQCGLKAYKRATLEQIAAAMTIHGFAADVEILAIARGLRLTVADVPVRVTYESAKSSVKLLRSGIAMAFDVIRIAVRHRRWRQAHGGPSSATASPTGARREGTKQRP